MQFYWATLEQSQQFIRQRLASSGKVFSWNSAVRDVVHGVFDKLTPVRGASVLGLVRAILVVQLQY